LRSGNRRELGESYCITGVRSCRQGRRAPSALQKSRLYDLGMVTRRMRGVRCPFLGIDGFISVAVHHADSRRDVFFAAHDQVRAKWHSCAIDRSHFQALPVGQHDLVPFCNTVSTPAAIVTASESTIRAISLSLRRAASYRVTSIVSPTAASVCVA